ncbi:DUF2336 domain-containing protein [Ferirhizobium litorale]
MATVTSFESMSHPSRSALRQFAELFEPLFHASSEEARRQAVAALSQCDHVPPAVALFIGCQPIAVAAPFLSCSPALDDETLVTIARTQGAAHTRAIVRRERLSPAVIDALVGLRHLDAPRKADPLRDSRPVEAPLGASPADPSDAKVAGQLLTAAEREESLRRQLKELVRHLYRGDDDRLGLRTVSDTQNALLVRFARLREAVDFVTTLADALTSSRALAERILLDLSGHQLATTLVGIGMQARDIAFVLCRFYPHLADRDGDSDRATAMLAALDPGECAARVDAWRHADDYTFDGRERVIAGNRERAPAAAPRGQTAARPPQRLFGRAGK